MRKQLLGGSASSKGEASNSIFFQKNKAKENTKKAIACMLVLTLVFSLFSPLSAFADSENPEELNTEIIQPEQEYSDQGFQPLEEVIVTSGEEEKQAPSSNESSIDDPYLVKIDYIDTVTKDSLVVSYQEIVSGGQVWSVDSPDIKGYMLVDESQMTLSGTATGSNRNLSYVVEYKETMVTYNVVHMLETEKGVYSDYLTDIEYAYADTTVTASPKTFENYRCITEVKDLNVIVSADGNSTVYIYYDQIKPVYTIFFYTQGTYVPYIAGYEGSSIAAPTKEPQRLGYRFIGWDQVIPDTMPNHNMYINALWEGDVVDYTINYYKQSPVKTSEYFLASSKQATGKTGETTSSAPLDHIDLSETGNFAWYEYSSETSETIKADGSTVIDVYYDLIMIELTMGFRKDDGTYYTISTQKVPALSSDFVYPSNEELWGMYHAQGGTKTKLEGWMADTGTSTGTYVGSMVLMDTMTDFDSRTAIYSAQFSTSTLNAYYLYWYKENLDGTWFLEKTAVHNFPASSLNLTIGTEPKGGYVLDYSRLSSSRYNGLNFDSLTWNDWVYMSPGKYKSTMYSTGNVLELRQHLRTFNTNYVSLGTVSQTVQHKFSEPYSTSEADTSSLVPPQEGFVFAGWYDNPDFKGEPVEDFVTEATDTNYYAKWERERLTVTFDANGAAPIEDQKVEYGGIVTKPTDPSKEDADFVGWFYKNNTGMLVRFEFDRTIEANTNLIAIYNPQYEVVNYSVVHQTVDGEVLAKEEGLTGSYTTVAIAKALGANDSRRNGYHYCDMLYKNIVLTLDPSQNVITFYYSKTPMLTYTVHYVDRATGNSLRSSDSLFTPDWLKIVEPRAIEGYAVESNIGFVSRHSLTHTFYYNAVTPPVVPDPDPVTPPAVVNPDQPTPPTPVEVEPEPTPEPSSEGELSPEQIIAKSEIVETLPGVIGTIENVATPFEQLFEEGETPLASSNAPSCWVHWYILSGIMVSVIYAALVILRRRKFSNALAEYEGDAVEEGRSRFIPGYETMLPGTNV